MDFIEIVDLYNRETKWAWTQVQEYIDDCIRDYELEMESRIEDQLYLDCNEQMKMMKKNTIDQLRDTIYTLKKIQRSVFNEHQFSKLSNQQSLF